MIGAGAAWTVLTKKIREQKAQYTDDLTSGKFTGEIGARQLVARIEMLEWVLGTAAGILGDNKPTTQTADEDEL